MWDRCLFVFVVVGAASCSQSAPVVRSSPPAVVQEPEEPASLTYLGVAGWQLSSGSATLLVDPYFTRVARADDERPLAPDETQISRYAPAHADAILVGHSHYDHLLDVPSLARRTGAVVVGTESTSHVARASGPSSARIVVAHPGEELRIGPFHVQVVGALHSLTGQLDGVIPNDVSLPMLARDYREGGTLQYLVHFGQHTVLFIGTANFVEANLTGLRPEVAVVAIGLREKIPDYTCRIMHALGNPRRVFPNHFDDLRAPLEPGASYAAETQAELNAFAVEVRACSPETRVEIPITMRPTSL